MRVLALCFVLVTALGSEARQKAVSVSDAWVKAPAPGETSAAAFVAIDNPTMYEVYVVKAAADVAKQVQFRQASEASDTTPTIVPELSVPAYGSLTLKPDGVHLVLRDLTRALTPGDKITITLTTDGGVTLSAPAVVRAP